MADNINLAKPLKITTPGIAPIADLVVADVAALEAIGSPWLGMTVYVEADGKSRKITALKDVAVGPLTKKAVGTYELIPDQSALDGKADADHNHDGTYAPLTGGKIPSQYLDVPTGIKQFALSRPKNDNALHLYLEAAEDADYATVVLVIDTLNVAADRAKVRLSEDSGIAQRWLSMPEDGAGSAYDDAPAVVNLAELTGPQYYLRYRWYNADTSGDWHCALFPACGGGSGGGADGVSPTIEIDPETRNWIINGADTGICAEGNGTGGTGGAEGLYPNSMSVTMPGNTNIVTIETGLTPAWFRSPDGTFYNALLGRIISKTDSQLKMDLTALTEELNVLYLSGTWTMYFAGGSEAATIESVSVSIDDSVTVAGASNTGTKTAAKLDFKLPKKIFTDSANNAYKTVSSLLYQAGLVTNPNEFPPELAADLPDIPEGVSPDSSLYPKLELGDEPVIADGNQVWYIYPNGQGTKDGSSWDNAMANIKDAVAAATSGDVIYVMEGRYPLVSNIIPKAGVPIYGGFVDADRTWSGRSPFVHRSIFDANNLAAGFVAANTTDDTICDGLTLLNSTCTTAVMCKTVRHCVIMGANVSSAVVKASVVNRCLIKGCKSTSTYTSLGTISSNYSYIVDGSATNCSIVNCNSSANSSGPGTINGNSSNIVGGSATNCSIVNCNSISNGTNTSSNHSNIVGGSATNCSIVNCISSGTSTSNYSNIVGGSATNCLIVNCTSFYYYLGSNNSSNIVGGSVINCSIVRTKGSIRDNNSLKNNIFFLLDGKEYSGTTCASTKSGQSVKLSEDNTQTRFISLGTVTEIGAIEIDDPETFDWSQFGNFRPADSYSALVGAGTYDSDVTTDADGNPRPNPPSIGAYEVPPQA